MYGVYIDTYNVQTKPDQANFNKDTMILIRATLFLGLISPNDSKAVSYIIVELYLVCLHG